MLAVEEHASNDISRAKGMPVKAGFALDSYAAFIRWARSGRRSAS